MRIKRFSLLLILLLLGPLVSWSQENDPKKQAYELAKEGLNLVNKGRLDEALRVFEEGYRLDPDNPGFQYEMAVVWYLKKDYQRCISILEKVIGDPAANDQYYQLLGNAYDMSGQTAKARKTYAAGIKRFPDSGVLFMESGVLEYVHKNTPEALRYWEAGIVASPGFASDYYWLAKHYASTTEKIWSVLYGEMFIHLERNSERTLEMSELVYGVYRRAINWKKGDTLRVDFSKYSPVIHTQGQQPPFEQVFSECMYKAADSLIREGADSLGYHEMCRIRGLFLFFWQRSGFSSFYPVIMFDWLSALPDSSYQESFHRWLFLKGNEDAFQSWYYSSPDSYNAFAAWYRKHPLKISRENFFSRSKF
jgi:tetratricopeptide (TPR) repeat protein